MVNEASPGSLDPALCLGTTAQQFLVHCRVARNLSAHTLRAYATDLREFVRFAGAETELGACDRACLRAYLQHLFDARGLKETSVKRRMACLKAMFRWLEREEAIAANPFHRLDLKIRLPKRLPRSLSTGEVRELLRAAARAANRGAGAARRARFADLTAHLALELLFSTGMRVGELVAVTLERVDLEDGVVRIVGKGDRERRVFLPDEGVRRLVARYLERRARLAPSVETLLVTPRGSAASTQYVRQLLHRLRATTRLARRVTPHMLRHTAATQLLEAGVDIRYVQRLLGHHSIATTELYTQVSDASLRHVIVGAKARERVWGASRGGDDDREARGKLSREASDN
ncbi:MAG TPA: tyrosine-type recombinase/integrase [Alphaproteobacteria bacterium]|nr:tyrosine-type recombinase/integrase [Alphaproteobacteria bacterium]